jgi:protein gp37
MAKTKIEWATDSWNPIRARNRTTHKAGWYCEHATPGCEHCYSEAMNRRVGTRVDYARQNRDQVEVFLDERILDGPLSWRDPRRVFVCSMTDLFAEFVPDAWIGQIWGVMALAPQHTFLVLTKRAARMRQWCGWVEEESGEKNPAAHGVAELYVGHPAIAEKWPLNRERAIGVAQRGWPLPNVWLIVSVEDQRRADERIPELLATPAAVRGISAEPLLGPVDLNRLVIASDLDTTLFCDAITGRHHAECRIDSIKAIGEGNWKSPALPPVHPGLDWVIAGGESGPGARPMHPDWARSLRDQCAAAGVPFFFKQWGEFSPVGYPDGVADPTEHLWIRVGKKAAGRELDGRTWDEYPMAPWHEEHR